MRRRSDSRDIVFELEIQRPEELTQEEDIQSKTLDAADVSVK